MNLEIPEQLQERFQLGAVALNEGRRQMVAAMREYWEEASEKIGFSQMTMYEEFAALTEISTGEPTITARTVRYYWENTCDLPAALFEKFMQGEFTFEHCEADKALTGRRGIERGQAITWAVKHADKGRKVASVKKMWLHFADENGKDYDVILCNQWRRKLTALQAMKLPETMPQQNRLKIAYHTGEIVKLFDN